MKKLLFSISLFVSTGMLVSSPEVTLKKQNDRCHAMAQLASDSGLPKELIYSSCLKANAMLGSSQEPTKEQKQDLCNEIVQLASKSGVPTNFLTTSICNKEEFSRETLLAQYKLTLLQLAVLYNVPDEKIKEIVQDAR